MEAKAVIESIRKERAHHDKNSTSLTTTLLQLIHSGLKGDHKYIFELLQNADDAALSDHELGITVTHIPQPGTGGYLTFSHTGKHFSATDVERITDSARTDQVGKAHEQDKTGFKGIGFKSVFSIAETVYVLSDEYQFRFDKHHDQWQSCPKGQSYPWMLIPIWTENNDLPEAVKASIKPNEVTFILALTEDFSLEDEFSFILNNPTMMLFLRNARNVTLKQADKPLTFIEITEADQQKQIFINGQLHSSWLLHDVNIPMAGRAQTELKKLKQHDYPARLMKAPSTTITFAAKISNNRITPVKGQLFSYLPTQVLTGLPFLVNADFLLNPERTTVNDNAWNAFLLEEIGRQQIMWLQHIARDPRYKMQVLNIFSCKTTIQGVNTICRKGYNKGLTDGINTIPFVPCYPDPNDLTTFTHVVVDETGIFRAVPSLQTKDPVAHYDLENRAQLEWRNRVITFDRLGKLLPQYAEQHKTVAFQQALLRFLATCEKAKDFAFQRQLAGTAFLLTQNGDLAAPNSPLYFPLGAAATALPPEISLTHLHADIAPDAGTKAFLKLLGVHSVRPIDIIRGKIFDLIRSKKITHNNVIAITQFIFAAFRQNQLTDHDWKTLHHLPVLCVRGTLSPAYRTYLSHEYGPELPLDQTAIQKDFFVSTRYGAASEVEFSLWKSFFLQLGVPESIRFHAATLSIKGLKALYGQDIITRYRNKLASKDMATAGGKIDSHFIYHFIHCALLVHLDDLAFAQYFWQALLRNWQVIQNASQAIYSFGTGGKKVEYSFLQFLLQEVFPTLRDNTGQPRLTTEIYPPEFAPYAHVVPVAQLDAELSEEQIAYLGFKTELSCALIIDQLYKLNRDNDKDVQKYAALIRGIALLNPESDDFKSNRAKLEKWCEQGRLPAQNGKLQSLGKLRCFGLTDTSKSPAVNSSHWLREFPGMTRDDMVRVAELLNIIVITENEIAFKADQAEPDDEASDRIRMILPYFALAEARKTGTDSDVILSNLLQTLSRISFFKAHRISHFYTGNHQQAQQVFAHIDGEGNFFYKSGYSTQRTRQQFCECLSRFLGLSEESALFFKELLYDEDVADLMQEHGYDVSHLPTATTTAPSELPDEDQPTTPRDALLDDSFNHLPPTPGTASPAPIIPGEMPTTPQYPRARSESPSTEVATPIMSKTTSVTTQITTRDWRPQVAVADIPMSTQFDVFVPKPTPVIPSAPHTNTPVNKSTKGPKPPSSPPTEIPKASTIKQQSKTELSDDAKKAIGDWGEAYVYRKLQLHYQTKYSDCTYAPNDTGFTIQGTHRGMPLSLTVIWHNITDESYLPRDFTIKKTGVGKKGVQKIDEERVIEVKATRSPTASLMRISRNEAQTMFQLGDRYRFFRVYNAGTENAKVTKLKNPAEKMVNAELPVDSIKLTL